MPKKTEQQRISGTVVVVLEGTRLFSSFSCE